MNESVRSGDPVVVHTIVRADQAAVARLAYGENYVALPMAHCIEADSAEYRWRHGGRWNSIRVEAAGSADYAAEGTPGNFITEHYWGYSRRYEYHVQHPPWKLRAASRARFEGDPAFYGSEFERVLAAEPDSALLAEGSPVTVFHPHPVGG